jgi:hypothetical protein
MRKISWYWRLLTCVLLGLASGALAALHAQDDGSNGPPKVLVIQREFTKPGKEGALHEKTEAAFLHALEEGHARPRYLAVVSLSGQPRALFLNGYPSFAAWEEENKGIENDAALSSALDRAYVADGDLLSETNQSVWMRREDLSLNSGNLDGARYMEFTQFLVRPGHMKDWDELVKMVQQGYRKGVPEANWTVFQQQYGTAANAFLVITPLKSLTEVDHMMTSDKGFTDAMGEEGMKRLRELEVVCIESEQTNLFRINPRMSYPREAWVKADPTFWKPKPVGTAKVATTKKVQAKPAQ